MLKRLARNGLLATLALVGLRAQSAEEPVGLVLAAGPEARLLRRTARAPVPAQVGEILFAGDRLRTGNGRASYLYCPSQTSQTLDAQAEALFQVAEVKLQRGKIAAEQPVAVCFLPPSVQLGAASRQHAGALLVRDVPPPLQLISPVVGPALDSPPVFFWHSMKGADSYQIEVGTAAGTLLWRSEVASTEIRYPDHAPPLVAPSTYMWKVIASAGGKPIAATEAKFQMLRSAETQRLRENLTEILSAVDRDPQNPALRLAKAARLERAGLLPEAFDEYETLERSWKDTGWLRAKLFQLRDALRGSQRNILEP